MHGWYSDSSYWDSWEKHFKSNGWTWQNSERGYGYIEPSEPLWYLTDHESNAKQLKKLLVCHSLGMHLIPNPIIKDASHIILLNSFSRFIPFGKESRAIKIALEGMQKQIGKATENQMLLKFAQKANKAIVNAASIAVNLNSEIFLT